MEVTPVTVTLSPKEIKVIKCNGVGTCKKKKKHNMYTIPPDYLSHIVVIGKLQAALNVCQHRYHAVSKYKAPYPL